MDDSSALHNDKDQRSAHLTLGEGEIWKAHEDPMSLFMKQSESNNIRVNS